MARFSLDSNILVYAADSREAVRQVSAVRILARAPYCDCVLTPQWLAEFFNAVTRKGIIPDFPDECRFSCTGRPNLA